MALTPRKAKPEQGKLKIGLYGRAGTGKTLTALMFAEWLAEKEKKEILFIDTEPGGTDFYMMDVPEREVHPKAFDFSIIRTKEIMAVRDYIPTIDTKKYGVLVIDSATHLWDSANELWTGKKTSQGQNPIQAYAVIKKPFRQVIDNGRAADLHFIICGREQNEFERHDDGEWDFKGTRMRAERETGHEPDITCQMMQERNVKTKEWKIEMYVEKDHSGLLQGKTIEWPTGETLEPWYNLVKGVQHVPTQTIEQASEKDVAARAAEEEARAAERVALYNSIRESMLRANTLDELRAAWSLTVGKKMKLGDEAYEALEVVKDAEKARIMQRQSYKPVPEGKKAEKEEVDA